MLSLPNAANVDKEDPDYENLTRRMKYVVSVSEQFWKRWRTEYLQELRELHRVQLQRSNSQHVNPISEGKIVIVFEEGAPRHSWRLEQVIVSPDGMVRSAAVRVFSKQGHPTTLRQPVQHLYPLEVESCEHSVQPEDDESGQTALVMPRQ